MHILPLLARPLARVISRKLSHESVNAAYHQHEVFKYLMENGSGTVYGTLHKFGHIKSYDDFRKLVPIVDYETLRPYIERSAAGEKDVLWPGMPKYFATTSGTTSGSKYIPITPDSIHNHINTARNALLLYVKRSGNYRMAAHGMIFLQGSPVLEKKGVIPAGRLSGIVAHHVPAYLQKNRMPSWKANCIDDWETKVDAIVEETLKRRMSVISGIPSWLRMYFERLVERTGRPVGDIFPDFSLMVHGGVNYEPYRPVMENLIGRPVDTLETYPASEGFIAFQDSGEGEGLLLNVNSGIFFEFIPVSEVDAASPERISLEEVETGTDYALVLSSNAGLWAYMLGDTVRFVSLNPYRLLVTGRVSQYISAFGEHVIASEVEEALAEMSSAAGARVNEFTVVPHISPASGLPHHEWLIEFGKEPPSVEKFASGLDLAMRKRNHYYNDLVGGKVLGPLKIKKLPPGSFRDFLKLKGKLGGQNKVVHAANCRDQADELLDMVSRQGPPPSSSR
ncbi:MAG: GH3 auxin-responsive promoter family protein [Bacteroidales bacterium]|jgi:phenylacetate-coenzyme A ligase PaaK-like adenylate-forming protein|nr:GH3 auxin-responsive promoter family protein [Bacteroidales bacterium]